MEIIRESSTSLERVQIMVLTKVRHDVLYQFIFGVKKGVAIYLMGANVNEKCALIRTGGCNMLGEKDRFLFH